MWVRAALASVLVVGTGSLAVFSADSAQAAEVNYVALGDSYSSGVGAGDYDAKDPECKRSANAYSQEWVKKFSMEKVGRFDFVACSGAKTNDVESKQLSALNAKTTMVTMTIGGNDVGFAPIIAQCLITNLFDDAPCIASAFTAGVFAERQMPKRLDALYKKIKDKAPNADVYVLEYPRIFETGECGLFGLKSPQRMAINQATSKLNRAIRDTAKSNGFRFVEAEKVFSGHGVCTTPREDAWVTDASAGRDLYHANKEGHEAYAVLLDAAVRGVGLPE